MQNKVESEMDEAANHGAVKFGDTEKTATEKGGFLSETILDEANPSNAGNCKFYLYLTFALTISLPFKQTQYIQSLSSH